MAFFLLFKRSSHNLIHENFMGFLGPVTHGIYASACSLIKQFSLYFLRRLLLAAIYYDVVQKVPVEQ